MGIHTKRSFIDLINGINTISFEPRYIYHKKYISLMGDDDDYKNY